MLTVPTPRADGARELASLEPWRFLVPLAAWSVALFAVLRTAQFAAWIVPPIIALQRNVALWYGGQTAALPVAVTADCSGTDVMALCLATVLAYPASWSSRARGTLLLFPLLLVNTVRIVTLSEATRWPSLFLTLHYYVWPAMLIAAAVLLVWAWIRSLESSPRPADRALLLATACFGPFVLATPWLASSAFVADGCAWVAQAAASVIARAGVGTEVHGATLMTARGGFIVTPECIVSPIVPLCVFGALWWPRTFERRLAALAMVVPLVAGLAVARLLVLAAPSAWVGSPLHVVHGFYQLLVFAAIVLTASILGARHARSRNPLLRALVATTLAAAAGVACGPAYNAFVLRATAWMTAVAPHATMTLSSASDVQGALALLPPYQVALLLAAVGAYGAPATSRRLGVALAVLSISHVALLMALGESAVHAGVWPHAIVIRGWAALLPVGLAALVLQPTPAIFDTKRQEDRAYQAFWHRVGSEFPDLGGAASTTLYFENEKRLFVEHAGDLRGRRVLKTDLWDEAKNTRILQWVQRQGARVSGIDISEPLLVQARAEFPGASLAAAGADVRALPFSDGVFDLVYSMGTVEHFQESDLAVREIHRVLKPGGRAIVGVPNRLDPFLRPLLVDVLFRLGLYAYGYEKSYTRAGLRRMVEAAGLVVTAETAILFIPGWLRMMDLACHVWCRPLARLTGVGVRAFGWLYAHVPSVRRHGYLLVAVAERADPDRD